MHDMKYWYGGSLENREQADLDLYQCVKKVAHNSWATLIYRGVKLGHHSPIKNKYNWSWGWVTPRQNVPLTSAEKNIALYELRRLPYASEYIDQVINESFFVDLNHSFLFL